MFAHEPEQCRRPQDAILQLTPPWPPQDGVACVPTKEGRGAVEEVQPASQSEGKPHWFRACLLQLGFSEKRKEYTICKDAVFSILEVAVP